MVMTDTTMIDRLKQFVESEMRSCSMGYRRHYTTIRLQDVGRSSGYRRYCNRTYGITENRMHGVWKSESTVIKIYVYYVLLGHVVEKTEERIV